MEEHATRLGLGPAALKAAIVADLDESQLAAAEVEMIASALANAIEANNAEILHQLRQMLVLEQGQTPAAETCGVNLLVQAAIPASEIGFLAAGEATEPDFKKAANAGVRRQRPSRGRGRRSAGGGLDVGRTGDRTDFYSGRLAAYRAWRNGGGI